MRLPVLCIPRPNDYGSGGGGYDSPPQVPWRGTNCHIEARLFAEVSAPRYQVALLTFGLSYASALAVIIGIGHPFTQRFAPHADLRTFLVD
jgi:hypothetical protein